MPFIGKLPDVGAFRLIDSITTSATDTYALQVEGLSYFPSSARNLIVSLNGVTQAPESAYTVSGSNIVFASALTASDVIDYILVIGESVDIGTPSDNTVGNAQLKSDLDFSGKTLTFSADQISGDAINGGTISSFASTGIDDNATSTKLTVSDTGVDVTGTVTSDGLTVDGDATVSNAEAKLYLMDNNNTDGNALLRVNGDNFGVRRVTDNKVTETNRFNLDVATGDISFYEDTGTTAKFFWDASAESLGIGVAPSAKIHAYDSNTTGATIVARFDGNSAASNTSSGFRVETGGVTGNRHTRLYSAGTTQELRTYETSTGNRAVDCFFGISAGHIAFDNGDGTTEYGRFDSSGNLLVGTTNANPTSAGVNDAGVELSNTGGVRSTVASNPAATFNRKTDDGAVVLLRKDGSTKGNIGISGGDEPYFARNAGTTSGIKIANGALYPCQSDGTNHDAAQNLGLSNVRWANLYLSGGAYLGGTAGANHLDDYEEGTWTPVANNLTVNYSSVVSSGSYVKIGKLVTATFAIQWSSANVGAGYAALNLPLLSSTDYGSGILIEVDQAPVSIDQLSMYTSSGQSLIYFRKRNAGGVSSICARTDLFGSSNRISGTIVYYTS